jgi:hypothetical protein
MDTMKKLSIPIALAAALAVGGAAAQAAVPAAPSRTIQLAPLTQGPLWPPSIVQNADGDFLVVGLILTEVSPGVVVPVPGAAVVSRHTVPPLNGQGREDFSNPFGAPYQVIRPLDLTPGSADMKTVLYASSFGPYTGNFGGGPRIPKEGETLYNLNMGGPGEEPCPEQLPSASQNSYTRERMPLHQVPVYGFRGDQVVYDPDTGLAVPQREERLDTFRREPITLGDYLRGTRELTITLTRYNDEVGAFTAARFDLRFRNMLPNAVYHVSLLRTHIFDPRPVRGNPTSLTVANVFVTDERGNAYISREIPNPFPDPATDDAGLRVVGIVGAYHSDFMNKAGCPGRFGSSIDTHAFFNTFGQGITELTDFITKPAPEMAGVSR